MGTESKNEYTDGKDLASLQLERLKKTVSWAAEKSPFYSKKFTENKTDTTINSLEDIRKLPFTDMKEYIEASPFDFVTLPLSSIVRINMWEKIKPLVKMYTREDVDAHIACIQNVVASAGVTKASIVGLLGDLSDSALLDVRAALEIMGATVVFLNADNDQTIKLLDTVKVDIIVGSSKRLLQMIVALQAYGRDIAEYDIKKIFCIHDAMRNQIKRHIESRADTKVINIFSSAILGTAGIFSECADNSGMHLQADSYFVEIVSFGSDQVIEDGSQLGELVITTLIDTAMPIIRLRTGQPAMFNSETCSCGCSLPRYTAP